RGIALAPQITGGPQERERRAGTENVAGIAGFGAAARAARTDLVRAAAHMAACTESLWRAVLAAAPDAVRHGPPNGGRLPNLLNVRIPGCAGESLLVLLALGGIAVSLGSACAAGAPAPSHVLLAMGLEPEAARGALRLSVGPTTTLAEV